MGNTGEIKKVSREKNIFFEHETKTRKIVRYVLYIGYGRYAAQFLDRLEHSECTNLFGDFFFAKIFKKKSPNGYNGDPYSKLPEVPGSGS